MRWLKQIEPIELYQGSDLPYIILENGVKLMHDNCYQEQSDQFEFNMRFKISRGQLTRRSTNYFSLKSFPTIIPFSDIVSLDDSILDGRLIRHKPNTIGENKNISIIKMPYLHGLSDQEFQDFTDSLENYDKSFLLIKDELDTLSRLLTDLVTVIRNSKMAWTRTCVKIAHEICEKKDRRYCWTHTIPDLNIDCYGLQGSSDMEKLQSCLDDIGIQNCSASWVD